MLLTSSRFNVVGGFTATERNIVSANFSDGIEITGVTTAGNVIRGNFIGTNPQPFTYTGAYGVRFEPVASLYQMRARYYEPVAARFLSRDPIWPRLDGLDPYEYAANNPLVSVDSLGLQSVPAFTCTASAGGVPMARTPV